MKQTAAQQVEHLTGPKKFLADLYQGATDMNHRNIADLFDHDPEAAFCDLGCDDGILTMEFAKKIGTKKVYGVDIDDWSKHKEIEFSAFDLNEKFKYDDNSFDVVHANQVIEHLYNSDNFIGEIYRILKPGGYAIVSTENASSWCNIFASIMGWQIFSLTNISSKKMGIGNPFAIHRSDKQEAVAWNHIRIYNIRGLKEYFEVFGFSVEAIRCAGYFPLPNFLGDIDKTHGHFMTFKVRKPKKQ